MDLSKVEKAKLLKLLTEHPGPAFEGWDQYGQPKLTDAAMRRSWESAQSNPAYDPEIEQALYAQHAKLGRSAQEAGMDANLETGFSGTSATTNYSMPPNLKFMDEAKQSYENERAVKSNNLLQDFLVRMGFNTVNRK